MRKYLYVCFLASVITVAKAQQEVPTIYLNKDVSTHFVSTLNIDYTDLSTQEVVGDLPLENILRIKPKQESDNLGYATIVGENFFLQFKLVYEKDLDKVHKQVRLDRPDSYIYKDSNNTSGQDSEGIPSNGNYSNPRYSMDRKQLAALSRKLMAERPSLNNVVSKENFMKLKLNNIWVSGDYIFIDYTANNKSNIPYSVDEIRYKIVDEKLLKATNSQDVGVRPEYSSSPGSFKDKKMRNIAAFRKFTFPEDKVLVIEMAEEQYSGRKVSLKIKYSDLLQARSIDTPELKETK